MRENFCPVNNPYGGLIHRHISALINGGWERPVDCRRKTHMSTSFGVFQQCVDVCDTIAHVIRVTRYAIMCIIITTFSRVKSNSCLTLLFFVLRTYFAICIRSFFDFDNCARNLRRDVFSFNCIARDMFAIVNVCASIAFNAFITSSTLCVRLLRVIVSISFVIVSSFHVVAFIVHSHYQIKFVSSNHVLLHYEIKFDNPNRIKFVSMC